MHVVQQRCYGIDRTQRLLKRRSDITSSAAKDKAELACILIPAEANNFPETESDRTEFPLKYSDRMASFRTRSAADHEWAVKKEGQVKRSKSLSRLNTMESEARKPNFLKFALFSKIVRSNSTRGGSEHESKRNVKRKTIYMKDLGSASLTNETSNKLPYSDCLPNSNRIIDSVVLKQPIQTQGNLAHPQLKQKDPSSRSQDAKDKQARETRRRNSRILVTRLELELAINKDDRKKLLSTIQSKTVNINEQDYYGKTLLHTACSVGNYHCAQMLVNAGAEVNLQDHAGFAPLHCAVVSNHVPCAAVLITAGADLMAPTRSMHTTLTLAHEEEMILLIGRALLLQDTISRNRTTKDDYSSLSANLRETKL